MTGLKSANNSNVSTLKEAINVSHLSTLSSVIDECKSILIIIDNEQLTIDQLIEKLDQLILDAQKLRRDILISKTTGTSATVAGSVLTIVGFCLTPFTFGISTVVLPAIGATLAGAGALTNIGASIADGCMTSNQATQITDLLEEFKKLQDRCYSKEIKLLKDVKLFTESEICSYDRQLDITKWLEKGYLHRDEKVDRKELK